MDAFINAIKVVLPVVLILALGCWFARARNFSAAQSQGLGKLAFWVCLPALLAREVARVDPGKLFDAKLCLGVCIVLILIGIIGYRYARWRKAPLDQIGVIAQAAFRSNMMYVGLPVLIFYFQSKLIGGSETDLQKAREHASGLAAVTTMVSIPILNGASILFFVLPRRHHAEQRLSVGRTVWMIVSNPLVVGTLAGFLIALTPQLGAWFGAQTVLGRALDLAASAALPLALFSTGAVLNPRLALTGWRRSMPVAALKLLIMPALGLPLLYAMGVRGESLATGTVLLACPTAAASYAMALELGGDDIFAGELVAVTTLLCPMTLVMWLSVLNLMPQ